MAIMNSHPDSVMLKYKQDIEEYTGKKCIIFLVEKIDKLLPLLKQEEIAESVGKTSGLKSMDRSREVVNLRKIYCILAQKAGYSLREIGIFLNGRDHTTIIHNIEKGKNHLETEQEFKALFDSIQGDLLTKYDHRLETETITHKTNNHE